MRFHDRLRKVARKNRAVLTGDPQGVMAALQITKRLVTESIKAEEPVTVLHALQTAIPMAAPKDPVRAYWAAVRVLLRHTTSDKSSLAILTDAIAAQGKTNIYAAKGPRP